MSGALKKWLGFRGAMLAAGMMLGTAGSAFATAPASTQDKHKWVEVQKRVEKQKMVEVHQSQSPRWDSLSDGSAWSDNNARRRYEEKQERLDRRYEERQRRYEEQRRRQLARRHEEQRRREYGTGGSGYSHRHDSWKKNADHQNHQHRADGSCYEQRHDGNRR